MVELAEMKKEDIEKCVGIFIDAFDVKKISENVSENNCQTTESKVETIRQYFEGCIDRNNHYALCLKDDNEIVGIITAWDTLSPYLGESIYVDTVAVAPKCQRNGYGTMMINEFIKMISKDKLIELNTKKKIPAFNLYKKLGFIETEFVILQKSPQMDRVMAEIEENKKLLAKLERLLALESDIQNNHENAQLSYE